MKTHETYSAEMRSAEIEFYGLTLLIPVLMVIAILLLAGCGTMRQPATDVVLTGAGGYIGYEASGGKIGGAVIGAGTGYLLSKVGNSQIDAALVEAGQRGYDRAMNQAVKQQYWIIQNQQRGSETTGPEPRYVTVQLPETVTADGTILKSTTTTIRTEQ